MSPYITILYLLFISKFYGSDSQHHPRIRLLPYCSRKTPPQVLKPSPSRIIEVTEEQEPSPLEEVVE